MPIFTLDNTVKERIVGFYSTGPEIRPADIAIAQMFLKYRNQAIFTIIDIRAEREEEGLPVKAYKMVETVPEDGEEIVLTFKHIPSEVGAYEAEEVCCVHWTIDCLSTACCCHVFTFAKKLF